MLKTADFGLGFQHLPQDLANVNALKKVTRSFGRCWKPRPLASVFNTSHGTWQMLMHEKPCLIPIMTLISHLKKKLREKSRECHNHKPQPFPDTKRKRKPTNPNKHKSNKRTKSTKISSLFPKRGNRNAKRTTDARTTKYGISVITKTYLYNSTLLNPNFI